MEKNVSIQINKSSLYLVSEIQERLSEEKGGDSKRRLLCQKEEKKNLFSHIMRKRPNIIH